MAAEKTLQDLFVETLKDIYYAEKQILRALPKMARQAKSPDLKQAFKTHRHETEGQVDRLQQIFEMLDKPARGKTCDAILGIVEEGKEVMEEFGNSPALDAGLVSAAQAVEHYEIARYGSLRTWAETLGQKQVVQLLDQTLQEAGKTDRTLSKLAMTAANRKTAA